MNFWSKTPTRPARKSENSCLVICAAATGYDSIISSIKAAAKMMQEAQQWV